MSSTAPLFAGPYSLRQLYQPLRGYWTERLEGDHGRQKERHHVVDLAEAFDAWLEPFDKNDALRVVAGGPGSGKSSFVKWWAAQVMQREPMVPTLLVPLHYLGTLNLEQAVGDYAMLCGFPANPLDTDAGERRLLLIFDSLDELDADQKRGRDAAAALVTAVRQVLLKNNHNFEVQVVLAGRALIVENLQGELNRERQIFQVVGYAPREAKGGWDDPDERLKSDQRQDWWRQWGELSGEQLAGLPAEITGNRNLADLADQPLLNHLLAITRAADPVALDASSSVNSVYASLLRHVWKRSWGEERQIADVKPLTPEQFNRLFESIGLAVWQQGGGRSTTLAAVAEVARLERLDTALPVFKEGAEKGALALLTAFFFRRAGSDETFELTHKTFGEYLTACRLARLIDDLHRLLPAGDIDEGEGLRRWYRLTHGARITVEILGFLEEELDRPSFSKELRRSKQQPVLEPRSLDAISARRDTLIRLFNANLVKGMPFEGVDGAGQPRTYREAERFTAAAELALFAAIGVCTCVMIENAKGLELEALRQAISWSPAWPDRDQDQRLSAWDLLRRLECGTAREVCARGYMQGINLENQILPTDLAELRSGVASAKSTNLHGTHLIRAHLRGAQLSGAYLRGADLMQADLRDASLVGADLGRSDLTRADVSGADLNLAILFSAKLCDAKLRGANLIDAILVHADLNKADLSGAVLRDADLRDADLGGADLRGAEGLTRRQLEVARNVAWDRVPSDLPDA